MKAWWIRPGVRVLAALLLPLLVPAIITALIWALPGDPAEIICPPSTCGGTSELAARWHLDQGPWSFFTRWVSEALTGEFGMSWRLEQGLPVAALLVESIPVTVKLVLLALVPIVLGVVGAATGIIPQRADGVFATVGLVPALVFALLGSAAVVVKFGASAFSEDANLWRLGIGAVVLGMSDGAFASAVSGVRSVFSAERNQRYVGIAILRGERPLANMLPNVAPALAGQMRARILHLLSGAVVVEVVLGLTGVGDLLWSGTLLQDFGVVLAAATTFACLSAVLLLLQAAVEVGVALHVRRAPPVADAMLAGGG
ncbi:ABC transporter permease [Deltaproteobacteria bacterium]|nr:ABC transporter permease [Deltaproteobacteria bacterium]